MKPTIAQRLAATLRTDDKNKQAARLRALGFWVPCWKCSGSGRIYGFSHVMGGICFACGGSKGRPCKIGRDNIADVEAKAASGALDAYFAKLRDKAAAKAAIKPLRAAIDADWKNGAIHTAFSKFHHTDAGTDKGAPAALVDAAGRVNDAWQIATRACLDAELGLLDARAVVADLKIAHALVRAENMLWQFSALA